MVDTTVSPLVTTFPDMCCPYACIYANACPIDRWALLHSPMENQFPHHKPVTADQQTDTRGKTVADGGQRHEPI